MRSFLDSHVYPKPRRQSLFQPYPYPQADDCGERAVRDRRRDFDKNRVEAAVQRPYVDIRQIHYSEGAKREGVFGVGDCGDEVCKGKPVSAYSGWIRI